MIAHLLASASAVHHVIVVRLAENDVPCFKVSAFEKLHSRHHTLTLWCGPTDTAARGGSGCFSSGDRFWLPIKVVSFFSLSHSLSLSESLFQELRSQLQKTGVLRPLKNPTNRYPQKSREGLHWLAGPEHQKRHRTLLLDTFLTLFLDLGDFFDICFDTPGRRAGEELLETFWEF